MKTIQKMKMIIGIITFIIIGTRDTFAQGVGIGTANPQAKLHVAGNIRIDSAQTVLAASRVAVLSPVGVLQSMPFDSLKKQMAAPQTVSWYSQEVPAQSSTTLNSPQARATLNLPAGTYVIFAYCEVFNSNVDAGVRAWFYEGGTELSFGIVYSNTSTYGSWSTVKTVSPVTNTNYTLSYSSWPNGTTSFIRRARIIALKLL